MKRMLLAAAGAACALAFHSVPAASESGFTSHSGTKTLEGRPGQIDCFGSQSGFRGGTHRDGDGRDMRRNGDGRGMRGNGCRSDVVMDWYGGEWALYNNRSWEPGSYNDWWNDRPDRAYPAWMRRNQDCSRQWYSGDTLRC